MQIVFLPNILTAIICFVFWGVYQLSVSLICFFIPDQFYNPNKFIFRSHAWEKDGKVYSKIFKVQKWKKFLPDGGAVLKDGYKKKNIDNFSRANMEKFVIETCRGELSHWLAIIPFWIFGFIAPPIVILPMFIYAIGINLPCIIAQRYNRPRFRKILDKS